MSDWGVIYEQINLPFRKTRCQSASSSFSVLSERHIRNREEIELHGKKRNCLTFQENILLINFAISIYFTMGMKSED